ncbi:MAG TPA: cupin domain-containing protein [Blastocatellia bacterium]
MAKRSLIQKLDDALEAVMARDKKTDFRPDDLDPRIAELLGIAADLRGMPTLEFKAKLKENLLRNSGQAGTGKVLAGKESGAAAGLVPHNISGAIAGMPGGDTRFVGTLNSYSIGLARLADQAPLWERYSSGEKFYSVLDGEIDILTISDDGPVHYNVPSGSVFVCPSGVWHWARPDSEASLLFIAPSEGEQSTAPEPGIDTDESRPVAGVESDAEDAIGRSQPGSRRTIAPPQSILGALSGVSELRIGPDTTPAQANKSFADLGSFDRYSLGVGRFYGRTPWERHAGDELLHVVDGQVELTTLTDQGSVNNTLRAGSIFVCPEGLWHRQFSRSGVTAFFASPRPTDVSFAEDPRQ